MAAEAKRTCRSKSAVISAFTEETARTRRFPGVGFRGDDAARRAWVIGTGLDVREVVEMLEDVGSVEPLVAESHLSGPAPLLRICAEGGRSHAGCVLVGSLRHHHFGPIIARMRSLLVDRPDPSAWQDVSIAL